MKDHLVVFDTTLRDGLQTPGLPAISCDARVEIALMLERMGVDVIEAGFPTSSDANYNAVDLISRAITTSTVCSLALATEASIARANDAMQHARHSRAHIFLGSSAIHLHKLGLSQDEMIAQAHKAVWYATNACHFDEIEFSPEDAGRTDFSFLCRVVETAIEAGARIINAPDTVGYCMPHEYAQRVAALLQRFRDPAIEWSVHCHDDFGCATANSLAGIGAGARQVECTLYNIGERAGNAALEEVVMAVRTRQDVFACDTHIDTTLLWETARTVEQITGVLIPRNKAIVGENAFAHESGIHQAGVLKNPAAYEVMHPADVGWKGVSLPLGPQSGRHALLARLSMIGIDVNTVDLMSVFERFKAYADANGQVSDDALRHIVGDTNPRREA